MTILPSHGNAFGGTRQQLLPQFEAAGSLTEELKPFLVGGDVELPQLSFAGTPLEQSRAAIVGVTYPNYFLPMLSSEASESDEEADSDDPDWLVQYCDFAYDSDANNSDWEVDEPHVIEEVGPVTDLDAHDCSFEACYGDGHWNLLETTLLGDRATFTGP